MLEAVEYLGRRRVGSNGTCIGGAATPSLPPVVTHAGEKYKVIIRYELGKAPDDVHPVHEWVLFTLNWRHWLHPHWYCYAPLIFCAHQLGCGCVGVVYVSLFICAHQLRCGRADAGYAPLFIWAHQLRCGCVSRHV